MRSLRALFVAAVITVAGCGGSSSGGGGSPGGITGAIKVAHLAESFGMRAQVHGGGYANAHLCAAIPNNDYYEELVINTEQILGLSSQGPLSVVDGYITVPEDPGIAPHPDWAELETRAVLIV